MKATLTQALLVGAGGFIGSVLRFAVSGSVHRALPFSSFPWGTLVVNVSGCLAIGFLAGLGETKQLLSPETRTFLLIGLLGGFTTFSTFGYESLALMRDTEYLRAGLNVALSVVVGLAAAWIGLVASRFV